MRYYAKQFIERTWMWRNPGNAPDDWSFLPRKRSGEVALDQQINDWVDATGVQIVNISPPAIVHYWLNQEMTYKCVMLAVMVTYYDPRTSQTDPAPASRE